LEADDGGGMKQYLIGGVVIVIFCTVIVSTIQWVVADVMGVFTHLPRHSHRVEEYNNFLGQFHSGIKDYDFERFKEMYRRKLGYEMDFIYVAQKLLDKLKDKNQVHGSTANLGVSGDAH